MIFLHATVWFVVNFLRLSLSEFSHYILIVKDDIKTDIRRN